MAADDVFFFKEISLLFSQLIGVTKLCLFHSTESISIITLSQGYLCGTTEDNWK